MQSVKNILHPWDRLHVRYGLRIELAKIDTQSKTSTLFPCTHHRTGIREVGEPHSSIGQHIIDVVLHFFEEWTRDLPISFSKWLLIRQLQFKFEIGHVSDVVL